MRFSPIADHGLIGDETACALVSGDGSIDWWCTPTLDAESVFASLLDPASGGEFSIRPVGSWESEQSYVPRTNVLRTVFETASGRATLTDFFPMDHELAGRNCIFRDLACEEGTVSIEAVFRPRFSYGEVEATVERRDGQIRASGGGHDLWLATGTSLRTLPNRAVATPTLSSGESIRFATRYGDRVPSLSEAEGVRERTEAFWTEWADGCDDRAPECIDERWHDLTRRSGLALKLLIQEETGAICAAPTTSLPEAIGGPRNWDYRYNWIRDAKLTVQALYALGQREEAERYFEWFLEICRKEPAEIQPVYGLAGETDLEERESETLCGCHHSQPVRIGNAAAHQDQHDVYGTIVQAIYETLQYGDGLEDEDWRSIRSIVDHVCEVWETPDVGIWEFREEPRHHVHSKLMCWVALDRALAISEEYDLEAPRERWVRERDEIHETVCERGYSEDRGSFVQTFDGEDHLDAATLLIPIVGFLPGDDERVLGTIDAIQSELTTDNGLVYRYRRDDGLEGEEGAFVLCSFWLVDALALAGRLEEAESLFERVVEFANPLGLFAEEVEPGTENHLGNFPQAFSHIGLINSALYLGAAKGSGVDGGEFSLSPCP
jgi:alpha,alpha-trehalase